MDIVVQESIEDLRGAKLKLIGVGDAGARIVGSSPQDSNFHEDVDLLSIRSYDEIDTALEGADFVFIVVEFSDSEGIKLAANVAEVAKKYGALTFSILQTSSGFKDSSQMEDILLKSVSDATAITPNSDFSSTLLTVFSRFLLSEEGSYFDFDFADIRMMMSHKGLVYAGISEGFCGDTGAESVENALHFFYEDMVSIEEAKGALIGFTLHPSYPVECFNRELDFFHKNMSKETDLKWSLKLDDSMEASKVEITILVAGLTLKKSFC